MGEDVVVRMRPPRYVNPDLGLKPYSRYQVLYITHTVYRALCMKMVLEKILIVHWKQERLFMVLARSIRIESLYRYHTWYCYMYLHNSFYNIYSLYYRSL